MRSLRPGEVSTSWPTVISVVIDRAGIWTQGSRDVPPQVSCRIFLPLLHGGTKEVFLLGKVRKDSVLGTPTMCHLAPIMNS